MGGSETKAPVLLLARLYLSSLPGDRKYRWQGNCRVVGPNLMMMVRMMMRRDREGGVVGVCVCVSVRQ